MAYKVNFASISGTRYTVWIGEASGQDIELKGAPDTFVTSEESGGDLFTPVRLHTGVIRVIDTGTLIQNIIPQNNTTTKVQLKYSTQNWWEGFLCAAGYSQPWDNNKCMIELPVQSVLSSLYDSTISTAYVGQMMSLGSIIAAGLSSIGYSSHAISIADDCNGAWAGALVNASVFFSREEVSNQGDRHTEYFGLSYGVIIEDICKLFGLMCRDTGLSILFATYDYPTMFNVRVLLDNFTFKGTNNEQGFIQGAKQAIVRLSIVEINDEMILLPHTTEDNSTVVTVDKVANGTVKVQLHQRADSTTETFNYLYYSDVNATPTSSNFTTCVSRSVVYTPLIPPVTDDPSFVTGAFPVRYSFTPNEDTSFHTLANGLMINCRRMLNYTDPMPSNIMPCYELKSGGEFSFADGYLNIVLGISCFAETLAGYDRRKTQYGIQNLTYKRNYRMFLQLQFGSKYWNGSSWVNGTYTFEVTTDGQDVIPNFGEGVATSRNRGLFFPIKEEMSGYVTLRIMNFGAFLVTLPNDQTEIHQVNSSIIRELGVYHVAALSETTSDRTENVYRQQIISAGFAEEKNIELSIGTMNNNIPSDRFIKSSATAYIEMLAYGQTNQRPEMHLLGRMAAYYNQVRRAFIAKVSADTSIAYRLYTYGGRYFAGIVKEHNWRDGTQDVEFIEVKTIE